MGSFTYSVDQRVDFGEASNYTGLGYPGWPNHSSGVPAGNGVASITVGPHASCAIFGDGQMKCIGRNEEGALGYGDTLARGGSAATLGSNLPFVPLAPDRTVRAVGLARGRTCAVLDDGSIRVWGEGFNGTALWAGTTEATDVACAREGCCLLFNTGGVKCFGGGGAFMGCAAEPPPSLPPVRPPRLPRPPSFPPRAEPGSLTCPPEPPTPCPSLSPSLSFPPSLSLPHGLCLPPPPSRSPSLALPPVAGTATR